MGQDHGMSYDRIRLCGRVSADAKSYNFTHYSTTVLKAHKGRENDKYQLTDAPYRSQLGPWFGLAPVPLGIAYQWFTINW